MRIWLLDVNIRPSLQPDPKGLVIHMEVKKMSEDAQEIAAMLDAVSDKVPKLLKDITDALFDPTKTKEFGANVAEFYKTMVDNGMPPEQAFELTKRFMDSSSPGAMISQAIGGAMGGGGGHDHDEFGDEIERKVKAKIAAKFDEDNDED